MLGEAAGMLELREQVSAETPKSLGARFGSQSVPVAPRGACEVSAQSLLLDRDATSQPYGVLRAAAADLAVIAPSPRGIDRTPFYSLVPKDFQANLRFRREVLKMGLADPKAAEELWIMSARDLLFFVNAFCWTYDPRKTPSVLPFVTYEYQDQALLDMQDAIGRRDILLEKSRDMGASWMMLTAFYHEWKFVDMSALMLASRNEDYVDKTDNPKCLFWKFDFLLEWEAPFMRTNALRTRLHLANLDNGSVIDGESTTGDLARGDRRKAMILDEFPAVNFADGYRALRSTQSVTKSRFFNGTPQGASGAYFDLLQTPIRRIRMHWSAHPEKSEGLYTSKDGVLQILKAPPGGYEADYPFLLDGKLRSPWYDAECERASSPTEIAAELDINYLGSACQFFDGPTLDKTSRETTRKPLVTGDLDFDMDTLEDGRFIEDARGPLSLWAYPDVAGRLSHDRDYVISVDLASRPPSRRPLALLRTLAFHQVRRCNVRLRLGRRRAPARCGRRLRPRRPCPRPLLRPGGRIRVPRLRSPT